MQFSKFHHFSLYAERVWRAHVASRMAQQELSAVRGVRGSLLPADVG